MMRRFDPVPWVYAALIVVVVAVFLHAFIGDDGLLVLAVIYVPTLLAGMILRFGESRYWW